MKVHRTKRTGIHTTKALLSGEAELKNYKLTQLLGLTNHCTASQVLLGDRSGRDLHRV